MAISKVRLLPASTGQTTFPMMSPLHSRRLPLLVLLPVLSLLSPCALGVAKADEAAAASEAAAKVRDPERAAALTAEALAMLDKGEDLTDEKQRLAAYIEGEKLAQQAVDLDDSNADAYFALFGNSGRRLLLESGFNPFNLIKVNRTLDRCLQLNPDHSDALAARGGMYRQLPGLFGGSLTKAEKDLKRSIELDPEATGARIELARVYHDMGQDDKALPLLEQALYWAEKLNKPRRVHEAQKAIDEFAGK
jgi:tetratricopeptide (TPR) repeat protein